MSYSKMKEKESARRLRELDKMGCEGDQRNDMERNCKEKNRMISDIVVEIWKF